MQTISHLKLMVNCKNKLGSTNHFNGTLYDMEGKTLVKTGHMSQE